MSLVDPSQIAQIRPSTYFALSSSGATLRASNSRSRFCVLSPRWTRGSVFGGSIGLSGSVSTPCASTGESEATTANTANAALTERLMYSLTSSPVQ